MKSIFLILSGLLYGLIIYAQPSIKSNTFIYKTVDTTKLRLAIYATVSEEKKFPAIIFFHGGGGFEQEDHAQFEHQAIHLTSRGMISILVEYRTKVKREIGNNDARASLKYLADNLQNLKIDPRKIVFSGGSRGGGLALSLGMNKIEGLKPFAYVLFNPGVKAGFDTIPRSPAPMIIFQGLDDHTVLPAYVEAFKNRVVKKGGKCQVLYYEGQGHGFFNYKTGENPYFKQTLMSTDAFLSDLDLFRSADFSNKNWYLGESCDK